MKVTVILNDKRLEGVFDFGDKVVIEKIPYEEDTVLVWKHVEDVVFTAKDVNGMGWYKHMIGKPKFKKVPDVTALKGSWYRYRVKSKNGEYYSDLCFNAILGMKPMSEIFAKA